MAATARHRLSTLALACALGAPWHGAIADLDVGVLMEQMREREQARTAAPQTGLPSFAFPSTAPLRAEPDDEGERLYRQAVANDQGSGVPRNLKRAAELYEQAARLGHVEAQMNIGLMYTQGTGVPRNDRVGVGWLRTAAEAGNAIAQYSYGLMLYEGRGTRQDYAGALNWYRRAAENGNAKAMNNIGIMTALGHGIAESNVDAFAWFAVAAENGEADAASNRDLTADVLTDTERGEAERALDALRRQLAQARRQ